MTPHLYSPARQAKHCLVLDHFIFLGHQKPGVRGDKDRSNNNNGDYYITLTAMIINIYGALSIGPVLS